MKDPLREILSGDSAPDAFSADLHARTLDRLGQARAGAIPPAADVLPRRRSGGTATVIALTVIITTGLWFAGGGDRPPAEQPVALVPLMSGLGEVVGPWGDLAGEPSRIASDQLALLHDDAARFGRFLGDRLPALPGPAATN